MDLSKEVDFQHLVMIEIKKEGYIKYDRRRKNKKIEELKDEWIKEYSKIQPNENKNLLDGIGFKKTIELEKKYKKLIREVIEEYNGKIKKYKKE